MCVGNNRRDYNLASYTLEKCSDWKYLMYVNKTENNEFSTLVEDTLYCVMNKPTLKGRRSTGDETRLIIHCMGSRPPILKMIRPLKASEKTGLLVVVFIEDSELEGFIRRCMEPYPLGSLEIRSESMR